MCMGVWVWGWVCILCAPPRSVQVRAYISQQVAVYVNGIDMSTAHGAVCVCVCMCMVRLNGDMTTQVSVNVCESVTA